MSVLKLWENAAKKIGQHVEELFQALYTVCSEIGYNVEIRKAYCDEAYDHFMKLIKDAKDEIKTTKHKLLEKISNLKEEIHLLGGELGIDARLHNNNNQPLLKVEAELETIARGLKSKKQYCLESLDELLEEKLCEAPGVEPVGESCIRVPTDEDLDSCKTYSDSFNEAAAKKIVKRVEQLFLALYYVCGEIGYNDETRKAYCDQAHDHFMKLIKDMRDEIETTKNKLLEKVSNLKEEIQVLAGELRVDPGLRNDNDQPLLEVVAKLESIARCLKFKKQRRLENLDGMLNEELCEALGFKSVGESCVGVPSDEDLDTLKLRLQMQELEKTRSPYTYEEVGSALMKMLNSLRITPALAYEIFSSKYPESFVLAADKMPKPRGLPDNLENNLEAAMGKAALKPEERKRVRLPQSKNKAMNKPPLTTTSHRTLGTATSMRGHGAVRGMRNGKTWLASSKTAKPRLFEKPRSHVNDRPAVICNSRIRRSGRVLKPSLARRLIPSNNYTLSGERRIRFFRQFLEDLGNPDE